MKSLMKILAMLVVSVSVNACNGPGWQPEPSSTSVNKIVRYQLVATKTITGPPGHTANLDHVVIGPIYSLNLKLKNRSGLVMKQVFTQLDNSPVVGGPENQIHFVDANGDDIPITNPTVGTYVTRTIPELRDGQEVVHPFRFRALGTYAVGSLKLGLIKKADISYGQHNDQSF